MLTDISHITLPDNFNEVTDFFLPEEAPMYGIMYPGAVQINKASGYYDIISFLAEQAKSRTQNKREFALELVHEGTRVIMRGHTINSIEGRVFIFRRLPSVIPKIEDTGMPPNLIDLLTHERLNSGGLVIIAGETGQGKSTTAAASIAYRLRKFGSFCLTIEDPVELPLQGFYDNTETGTRGVCFQTNVDADSIFDEIKSSLRSYPSISNSILFLGETRDSIMASEVLKIAANGHLVVTTMHGADLMTSLKRFMNLASSAPNAVESDVKSLFASVFKLLIHQRMEILPNKTRKIRPQILFSPNAASSVASRIRSGQLELLATEMQNQNMALKSGTAISAK